VAATLSDSFKAAFLVTDWRHRVLADTNSGLVDRHGEVQASVRRRPDVSRALEQCATTFETISIGDEFVVAPIAARRELLGYIWARHLNPRKRDDLLTTSLEQAARVIALEMMREREALETERRLHRDFIYELLSDQGSDHGPLESRARQMWRGYASPHRPLVISVVARRAVGASPLERARRLLAEDRPSDFVTVYGAYLIVLTNSTERSRVMSDSGEIQRLLAQNGISTGIAIGSACRGLADTRSATLTAKRVLEILSPRGIVWTEGLEALTVLFDSAHTERLETFVRSALRAFRGNELYMSTLLAYYEAGGNRAAAARQLRTHVNTVRSRLERIEELIGGSVDDSARAVPLRLALLARHLYSPS
jgi:sugar diacid utilization regulator